MFCIQACSKVFSYIISYGFFFSSTLIRVPVSIPFVYKPNYLQSHVRKHLFLRCEEPYYKNLLYNRKYHLKIAMFNTL